MANRNRNAMNDTRRWSGGRNYGPGVYQAENTNFGPANRYRSDLNTRLSYDSSDRRRLLDDDFSSYNRPRQDGSSDDLLGGRRSLLSGDSLYNDPLSIQEQLALRESQLAAASSLLKRQSDLIAGVGLMGMTGMGLNESDVRHPGGMRSRSRETDALGKRRSSSLGLGAKRRRPGSRSPLRGNRDGHQRGRSQRDAGGRRAVGRSRVDHLPRPGRTTKCYNCGKQGHLADKCRKPHNRDMRKCFTCGEIGHKSNSCPYQNEKEIKHETVYLCKACDLKCENESAYEDHKKDKKHINRMEEIDKMDDEEKNKILEKIKKQEILIAEEKKREEEREKRREARHKKESSKERTKEYTLSSIELRKIYDQIPSHDKDTPVGVDFVMAVTGFFCKLCNKFYKKETTAKVDHCCSVSHYHLWKKAQVEKLKEEAKKKAEEEAAAKEEKEKEANEEDRDVKAEDNTETNSSESASKVTDEVVDDKEESSTSEMKQDEESHQEDLEINGVDQNSFDQHLQVLDEFPSKTDLNEESNMVVEENEADVNPDGTPSLEPAEEGDNASCTVEQNEENPPEADGQSVKNDNDDASEN